MLQAPKRGMDEMKRRFEVFDHLLKCLKMLSCLLVIQSSETSQVQQNHPGFTKVLREDVKEDRKCLLMSGRARQE